MYVAARSGGFSSRGSSSYSGFLSSLFFLIPRSSFSKKKGAGQFFNIVDTSSRRFDKQKMNGSDPSCCRIWSNGTLFAGACISHRTKAKYSQRSILVVVILWNILFLPLFYLIISLAFYFSLYTSSTHKDVKSVGNWKL